MPNSIITLFRHLTGSLLLLFLAVSCRQDESLLPSAPGKGATSEVTLSVRIPDFWAANTRAVDEKGIAEITVAHTLGLFGYENFLCARYCEYIQTYSSYN